jgi:hypothetical protein
MQTLASCGRLRPQLFSSFIDRLLMISPDALLPHVTDDEANDLDHEEDDVTLSGTASGEEMTRIRSVVSRLILVQSTSRDRATGRAIHHNLREDGPGATEQPTATRPE